MKCDEIEKQIDSYIDDELNELFGDKVEQHLKACRACEKTFVNLRTVRRIIRKDISVPAASRLDGRVLKTFSRHHENQQKKKWRAVVFGQISIPKPAFALALLTFAAFTGLAFQLGKISATDVRLEMPTIAAVNPLTPISESNSAAKTVEESENKTSDAQVIKFIAVPVVKEKIVTRVIYINQQPVKENNLKADSAKSQPNNFPLNSSVNENRYLTQVNLKEFQPVAEMKVKITKKDENYEK